MESNWIDRFLNDRSTVVEPDGRPLYAYKCRTKEYDELKSIIYVAFNMLRGNWQPPFEALFCLYAAETWRRCHTGGSWKWETVFAEINHPEQGPVWIATTIKNGLAWWKRPLLRDKSGHRREFLITIACEGGLPLHLLKNENAHLSRYFRQLLAEYHRERRYSSDVSLLAHRLAPILPCSLHHEIVFSLSGELIQKVVSLQERVPDTTDPIAALNQKDPAWRNILPLPLEDDTIEHLLRNLVNEAHTLSITERQKIRWRRFLVQKGDEWTVEQLLELPNRISGVSLQAWTNKKDVSSRLRLFLHSSKGTTEQIALLTRLKGEAAEAVFRCEGLRRHGVKLTSAEILTGVRLRLSDGTTDYHLPVQGDQELGPLPWAFRIGQGQMDFIGEGTARCRENRMYVLAPLDGEFKGDCAIEPIGLSLSTERLLYELTGKNEWKHPELGTCRYQCACADETLEMLLLDGPRLSTMMEENPPFLGMPSLFAVNAEEIRRRINDACLEWRPFSAAGWPWHNDALECAGDVWIRHRDCTGSQLLLRKARVVPTSFRIRIEKIGIDPVEAGTVSLAGLGTCHVQCDGASGCRFEVRHLPDKVAIDSFAAAGVPVTHFACALTWSDGRSITIQLPFPRMGAAFVRGIRPIPPGGRVAVTRLASVHAIVQTPPGNSICYLNGRIKSCQAWSCELAIHEIIQLDGTGRGQFDLHRIHEKLSSMLALTAELDGVADLEIFDGSGRVLARIEVGLFELAFEPDYENFLLSVSPQSIEQLDQNWEQQLNIRMMRLWKPEAEPVPLEKRGAAIIWDIPQGLEPGPWLVLGEEGDWPRFRPVLWRIDGDAETDDSTLIRAIRERDRLTRQDLLWNLTKQLADDSNHPDWSRFQEHLRLTRLYPASTFDLFRHLVDSPEAMVVALLNSGDEEFDAIWSLAYQLPFSWHLVPVNSWREATTRYFSSLREALSTMGNGEDLAWQTFQAIRERVTVRQPFFRQVCDWLSTVLFPDRKLENSELAVARQAPQIILGLIEEEGRKLQGRHDADELYPDGPRVMEWQHRVDYSQNFRFKQFARPYRPIRCAPFVAANIALIGATYDSALLFELQRLRNFDKEWFDAAFAFALCLGLAERPSTPLEI